MPVTKIAHVLLSLQPGGLENGVVNVANRLDRSQFASSICCLKQAGEFANRLHGDVRVIEMGWRGGNDPGLVWRLARQLRAIGADIVHTRNAEAFMYGFLAGKLAGSPVIVHSEHGRTFDDRPIRFRVQRLFSRGASAIFAVTEQLKRDLVSHIGIPPERIDVLYNGVDLARFGNPPPAQECRAELGIAPGNIVIGSVGRLVTVKHYPLLLRAVQALNRPDVVVLLVGEGPEREALQSQARELGLESRLRMPGHSETVARLLGAMDVFVLPSVSEGMSNTLLEAMAARLPVVASRVGGNPEIVRDGIDGFIFESGSVEALTAHLSRLVGSEELRMRFGRAARERVLADFSIDVMISRYQQLYHSVLGVMPYESQHPAR